MVDNVSKKQNNLVPVPRFYIIDQRNKLNLTAEQVSRKLGLAKIYYYQIENGLRGRRMAAPLIYKLVNVLQIDAIKFLESEIEHIRLFNKINKIEKKS